MEVLGDVEALGPRLFGRRQDVEDHDRPHAGGVGGDNANARIFESDTSLGGHAQPLLTQ